MQDSLHNQRTAIEVYSFLIFEDQIFNNNYLRKTRKRLVARLSESPFNMSNLERVYGLPPYVDLELSSLQIFELMDWFKSEIQGYETSQPITKRLQYILFCLEKGVEHTESIWGDKNKFTIQYSISILSSVDGQKSILNARKNNPHKYSSRPQDTNFQKYDSPQLAFWCVDTDGLSLDTTSLNIGRKTSVGPLQRFFDPSKKHSEKLNRIEKFCHHPQRVSNDVEFPIKNNMNDFSYGGTDHFVILLTPNLEICSYSLRGNSKSILRRNLEMTHKLGDKMVIGFDAFIGNSRLSSSSSLPQALQLNPNSYNEILQLFLNSDSISHNWSSDNMDEFLAFVQPRAGFDKLGGPYIEAGLYLKKGLKGKDGKGIFPIYPNNTSIVSKISDHINVYKWTTNVKKNKINSKVINRFSAWGEPHRCNGKTKIPLDPDRVSTEILERYGTDVYGGFQPCQRIVKYKLRCRDHQ